MKKILLLGGSAQQVIAIETAKECGYRTVLCDYLPDNPGQYHADRFYLESTTDKETVLRIAEEEKVDGILAFASDPAAPTAAYVAEKLGLPGNPYDSVEILCHKDRFRAFLAENGFSSPEAASYEDEETAVKGIRKSRLPLIVKPVDSSGSKGVTVVRAAAQAEEAVRAAFSFSRGHKIISEEYLDHEGSVFVGGDIFINEGKVVYWGLMISIRDPGATLLVPVGESYPARLDDRQGTALRSALQRMADLLGIRFGSMNIEAMVLPDGRVYLIDIGPRSGGNMIPDLMSRIFDTDIVRLNILAAMGEELDIKTSDEPVFMTEYVLHALRDGVFKGVFLSDEVRPFIDDIFQYVKEGDPVRRFVNAAEALGIVFLRFPDVAAMHGIIDRITEHVSVIIQ